MEIDNNYVILYMNMYTMYAHNMYLYIGKERI